MKNIMIRKKEITSLLKLEVSKVQNKELEDVNNKLTIPYFENKGLESTVLSKPTSSIIKDIDDIKFNDEEMTAIINGFHFKTSLNKRDVSIYTDNDANIELDNLDSYLVVLDIYKQMSNEFDNLKLLNSKEISILLVEYALKEYVPQFNEEPFTINFVSSNNNDSEKAEGLDINKLSNLKGIDALNYINEKVGIVKHSDMPKEALEAQAKGLENFQFYEVGSEGFMGFMSIIAMATAPTKENFVGELSGLPGTSKSMAVEAAAYALGLTYYSMSAANDIFNEEDWFGKYAPRAEAKTSFDVEYIENLKSDEIDDVFYQVLGYRPVGIPMEDKKALLLSKNESNKAENSLEFEKIPTALGLAAKYGGVIDMQEIDMGDVRVQGLYKILSEKRYVDLGGEERNIHPNLNVVFTRNNNRDATKSLPVAFSNRINFHIVVNNVSHTEMYERFKAAMGKDFPIIEEYAHDMVKYMSTIGEVEEEVYMERGLTSFRTLRAWGRYYVDMQNIYPISIHDACKASVINKVARDEEHAEMLYIQMQQLI